jgi:aspartyl-tRNA(Asn)/glutamyl-tRNA(Gln) amidotransferase subunit A
VTIVEYARALRSGTATAERTTADCLAQIAARNAELNAFITVTGDSALAQAREADRELAAGRDRGALHGVPISLKDLIDVEGVPTTAASRVRAGHIAASDAAVTARLRAAGAVLVGKTNLHEFALGTTNEDSAYGPARHPLDPRRSPGGSSGGSAVAVATGMSLASIGTDTGGSIRIPSAMCGLVGLKPSAGEISTAGVVPLSATLDGVGPMAQSVADARVVYDALRGESPGPASGARPRRLGIPRDYFLALLDRQVESVFEQACDTIRAAGIAVVDVAIPHAGDLAAVYTHIVLSEAAVFHAAGLERRPDAYTPNVRLRLELGRAILAEDYVRALRGRERLRAEVDAALRGCDALLLPTVAVPATLLGVEMVAVGATEEPVRNITLRLTQLFNVTGHPALTLPCGHTAEGLPVGLQLAGHAGATGALLDVAEAIETYVDPGRSR